MVVKLKKKLKYKALLINCVFVAFYLCRSHHRPNCVRFLIAADRRPPAHLLLNYKYLENKTN